MIKVFHLFFLSASCFFGVCRLICLICAIVSVPHYFGFFFPCLYFFVVAFLCSCESAYLRNLFFFRLTLFVGFPNVFTPFFRFPCLYIFLSLLSFVPVSVHSLASRNETVGCCLSVAIAAAAPAATTQAVARQKKVRVGGSLSA